MGLLALHIGLDLGQQHDPSAVVIAAVGDRWADKIGRDAPPFEVDFIPRAENAPRETFYQVQSMERLDLGTEYLAVAAHVVKKIAALWKWEMAGRARGEIGGPTIPRKLFADATGLGAPVMEVLKRALKASPATEDCQLTPVTFSHGDTYTELGPTGVARLGKAFLVSRLQVLFQERLCFLPKSSREADAMLRELKEYEIRVDTNANDTYGAFKVGTHDDLVTALGLACLEDPIRYEIGLGPSLWR